MTIIETILQMARQNNGIVTTEVVVAKGIARGNIKYMENKGLLEKSARGVYILPESWENDFCNIQTRFKKGIFSLETALFLWNLSDRTPNYYCMTFPSTYNLTAAKSQNILCTQQKNEFYELGIVEVPTPGGIMVKAYNIEKTLCDIIRSNKTDIQIITSAFKNYVKLKERNIPLLSEYAKILNVENKVRNYLEVLI